MSYCEPGSSPVPSAPGAVRSGSKDPQQPPAASRLWQGENGSLWSFNDYPHAGSRSSVSGHAGCFKDGGRKDVQSLDLYFAYGMFALLSK